MCCFLSFQKYILLYVFYSKITIRLNYTYVYWLVCFLKVLKGLPYMFCVPKVVLSPVMLTLTPFHSKNNFWFGFLLVNMVHRSWFAQKVITQHSSPHIYFQGKFSGVPWPTYLSGLFHCIICKHSSIKTKTCRLCWFLCTTTLEPLS